MLKNPVACHSERSEQSRESLVFRAKLLASLGMIRRLTDSQSFFGILLGGTDTIALEKV